MLVLDRLRREDLPDDVAVCLIAEAGGPNLLADSEDDSDLSEEEDWEEEPTDDARGAPRGPLEDHLSALLAAAISGEPIPPVSDEQRVMMARERALRALTVDQAFEVVLQMEPRLTAIASDLASGAWASAPAEQDDEPSVVSEFLDQVHLPLPRSARDKMRSVVMEAEARARFTKARSDPLVGPFAQNPGDDLLRTATAREAVDRYFRSVGRGAADAPGWNEPMEFPSFRKAWVKARQRQRRARESR